MRARCQQLENELLKYGDLPGEVEVLKRRSRMLDDVTSERDSLYQRLKQLEGVEDEVQKLKDKANRVDELEKQLAQSKKDLQSTRRGSDAQAKGDAVFFLVRGVVVNNSRFVFF